MDEILYFNRLGALLSGILEPKLYDNVDLKSKLNSSKFASGVTQEKVSLKVHGLALAVAEDLAQKRVHELERKGVALVNRPQNEAQQSDFYKENLIQFVDGCPPKNVDLIKNYSLQTDESDFSFKNKSGYMMLDSDSDSGNDSVSTNISDTNMFSMSIKELQHQNFSMKLEIEKLCLKVQNLQKEISNVSSTFHEELTLVTSKIKNDFNSEKDELNIQKKILIKDTNFDNYSKVSNDANDRISLLEQQMVTVSNVTNECCAVVENLCRENLVVQEKQNFQQKAIGNEIDNLKCLLENLNTNSVAILQDTEEQIQLTENAPDTNSTKFGEPDLSSFDKIDFDFSYFSSWKKSDPIEKLLNMVENYCNSAHLNDDKFKILTTQLVLNSDELGMIINSSLTKMQSNDWSVFKLYLIQLLGKHFTDYKNLYNEYQRGEKSPGLALAELQYLYKLKFSNTITTLTPTDEETLVDKFISTCLQQPIKSHILANENISMENIAEKVKKFERIYSVQSDNNSHFEKTTNGTLSKILYDLNGVCALHLQSRCTFKNCKYKHKNKDEISASVLSAAQKLLEKV